MRRVEYPCISVGLREFLYSLPNVYSGISDEDTEDENMKDWKAKIRRGALAAVLLTLVCSMALAALS